MAYGGATAGGAAVAANEIANAIKAAGAIVSVEPGDFEVILRKTDAPLVVYAPSGLFKTRYHYLTPYRGLIFYTKAPAPLPLPPSAEVIAARKIWVPG